MLVLVRTISNQHGSCGVHILASCGVPRARACPPAYQVDCNTCSRVKTIMNQVMHGRYSAGSGQDGGESLEMRPAFRLLHTAEKLFELCFTMYAVRTLCDPSSRDRIRKNLACLTLGPVKLAEWEAEFHQPRASNASPHTQ